MKKSYIGNRGGDSIYRWRASQAYSVVLLEKTLRRGLLICLRGILGCSLVFDADMKDLIHHFIACCYDFFVLAK